MSQDTEYDNEQTMIVRRAVFGKQVESFINSEVGAYMIARANSQKLEALESLTTCDPEDSKMVRKHQNSVKIADNVVQWLEDAVSDGLQALAILDNRE